MEKTYTVELTAEQIKNIRNELFVRWFFLDKDGETGHASRVGDLVDIFDEVYRPIALAKRAEREHRETF